MTVAEALRHHPKLTVSELVKLTRKRPQDVRGEVTKLIARGLAKETVYVERVEK